MTNNILWIFAVFGFLLATRAHAQAPEVLNPPLKKYSQEKSKNSKHSAGAKAKFILGSQETKKERSVLFTRGCKGEVNAGACTGYTR